MNRTALPVLASLWLVACGPPGEVSSTGAEPSAEVRDDLRQALAPADVMQVTLSANQGAGQGPQGVFQTGFLHSPRLAVDGAQLASAQALGLAHGMVQSGTPTQGPSGTWVFGPVPHGNAVLRLTIQRQANLASFRLEAKPPTAPDAQYVVVASGRTERQGTEVKGEVGIDLDAWRGVDASQRGQGRALASFARGAAAKYACIKLERFTADPAVLAPVDSDFACHRALPSLDTRVRYAFRSELIPGSGLETAQARIRFLPTVGGRADYAVTSGDVPVNGTMKVSLCWDLKDREVYRHLELCLGAGACQVMSTVGSLSACRPELQLEDPPVPNEPACGQGTPSGGTQAPPGMPSGEVN